MANEGYSAPFVLQDILAQKRAVQHQKLVDSLNVVGAQAEMEAQSQRAAAEAAERQARAAALQSKQDEQNRYRAAVDDFLASPDFAQLPPAQQQAYKVAGMSGDTDLFKTVLGKSLETNNTPENPMYIVGPNGKITPALDPTTKQPIKTRGANPLLELGFPPQAPAGAQPQLYQAPDPQTGELVSHWLRPGEQPTDKTRIGGLAVGGTVRKGNEPAPKTPGRNVTAAEAAKLATLRAKAAPRPGLLWGTNDAPAADVEAYNQQLQTTISNYPGTPDVKDTVRDVLLKESPDVPTADIVKAHQGVFNPQELEQFADLLMITRGQ